MGLQGPNKTVDSHKLCVSAASKVHKPQRKTKDCPGVNTGYATNRLCDPGKVTETSPCLPSHIWGKKNPKTPQKN